MKRRKFIKTAGVGAAGVAAVTTVAAPAIAQSMPEVKWRLTSSFPKSLDTLYGGSELCAKLVGEMSDGKFQIRPFAAGDRFTAVDTQLASGVHFALNILKVLPERQVFRDYIQRATDRPAFRRSMEIQMKYASH